MSKSLMAGLHKKISFHPQYIHSSPLSVWHIPRKDFTFYYVSKLS